MGGFFSWSKMKSSLFPEITFPKIKVIADNGEQPVDKMMIMVTKPLENAIKQIHDLNLVQSATSRGSCEISAFLDWDADVDLCQQRIESKINEIRNDLPPETKITVEKMNPALLAVMGYSVESSGKDPIELKQIANNIIKPFLSQVDGVSSVRIQGGETKEYLVELNAGKMSALGITPQMIVTAMSQTNFLNSNGYSVLYKRLYLTVTDAGIYNMNDLENVVIRNDGKRIILLKDISKVSISPKVEYIKIYANGKESVLVNVFRQPNANLNDVSSAMKDKVEELNQILPEGIRLKPVYVQSDFVHDSINGVTESVWIGLLLAIIVAIVFLRSFKASVAILITIPVTIALSLIVLLLIGYDLNIMTLGAFAAAIGLITDDAIVVVEQIHRTHEEHPHERTSFLLVQSIRYLLPSMIGSSLSTIVIFLPFIIMSGVAGAYFTVLTNTMMIILVCSFFVTWLGLPVIYLILSHDRAPVDNEFQTVVASTRHHSWISFFIRKPWISFIMIILLVCAGYFIYPKLETGFLPEMDEGTIVFDYKSPAGTSIDETNRMLHSLEKIIMSVSEVEGYSRRSGTEMGFFITEPNKGDFLIQLKKNRKRSTEEIIAEIRSKVSANQPSLEIDFGQIISDMIGDLMSTAKPIEIKIFGPDPLKLKKFAGDISEILDSVKGTADVFNGIIMAGPTIEVKPDAIQLAQYGITPTDFQFQLQTQLEGVVIGNILENQQVTNIRMRYPQRESLNSYDQEWQSIFLPNGKVKPFSEFASVNMGEGVAEISRENLQSMIPVSARLDGRDLGSAMKEIKSKIHSNIHLPDGYHIKYGGAAAEQEKSFDELLFILLLASLLVFATLLFLFKDYRVALLILILAVLGVSGSWIALYITHTDLNVGSYTGLIMIIGIIGENAIFTFQQFKTSIRNSSVDDAIVYAIATRLRPKLMTALGAIIALMPLALATNRGAQMHQPLAIAVIGGFVIALPLLLIVYPSMLRLIFHRMKRRPSLSVPLP